MNDIIASKLVKLMETSTRHVWTSKQLSSRLHINATALSYVLRDLEKQGLVIINRDQKRTKYQWRRI
jgi:transcription initiation factor IIE alpha subunit